MAKVQLNDISNLTGNPTSAENALNDNFTRIEEAIENTLSRDGTQPNFLEASLDANSQRIVNLPYALTGSEPVTLAQVMALVTGEDWTGGVGIPAVVFYQENEPTATAPGQVWVKTSDLTIWIWTGSAWIRQADPNLQLAIDVANDASLAVGLLTPRVVAVEQDSASYNLAIIELESDAGLLASSIATTSADLDGLTAVVSVETLARIQGDEALASAINSIQAFTNKIYVQASAPADSPPGTLEEGDFWYDSDDGNHPYRWVSGAWVSVQDTSYTAPLYAAIESEETARIGGDAALANSVLSLQAQRESDYSLIVNNQLASVNADSALASDITSLEVSMTSANTDIGNLSATIVINNQARIGGDEANASSISTLNSTVGGLSTTVSSNTSSINGIQGRYTVQIDSNGFISGIDLIQNSAPGTAPSSTFTVLANAFRIVTPGLTPVVPFEVVGGVTYIKDVRIGTAVIDDLSITTGKIAAGAIVRPSQGYGNWNSALMTLASTGWTDLSMNGITAGFYLLDFVPGASCGRIGFNFTAYRHNSNSAFEMRLRRNDGVILNGVPIITLSTIWNTYQWEWMDDYPASTQHFYTVQLRPYPFVFSGTTGTWGIFQLNGTTFRR